MTAQDKEFAAVCRLTGASYSEEEKGRLLAQGHPEDADITRRAVRPELLGMNMPSLVKGAKIHVVEPVFSGSHRNAKFAGRREYVAEIVKDSYGGQKAQHTFTLNILASWGTDAFSEGDKKLRKGRNVYGNLVGVIEYPEDYHEQNAQKNERRAAANLRKHINWAKEGKFDRVDVDLLARNGYSHLVASVV